MNHHRPSRGLPILCLALAGFFSQAVCLALAWSSVGAYADEASHYQFPGLDNGPPFTFDLEAGGRLTITNNLTPGFMPPRVVLETPEMMVGIGIVPGDARGGLEPDLITVEPPVGMIAIPNEFLMEEGETVVVHIVTQEMM